MFKVGELVKWRRPLDEDYSYGYIVEINRNRATVSGTGYYKGVITIVHLKEVEKVKNGGKGFGGSEKCSKRSTP